MKPVLMARANAVTMTYVVAASGCALMWLAIAFSIAHAISSQRAAVVRHMSDLGKAIDAHASRTLEQVDAVLLLQREHIVTTGRADVLRAPSAALRNIVVQFGWIDKGGILRSSTTALPAQPLSLADREHFKVHINSTRDDLFVSKPVLGRATKRWSIQLTRRVVDHDGQFAGVVVASIDTDYFASYLRSLDLPNGTLARIIGMDGVTRATSDVTRAALGEIHQDAPFGDGASQAQLGVNQATTVHTHSGSLHIVTFMPRAPLMVVLSLDGFDSSAVWVGSAIPLTGLGMALTLLILYIVRSTFAMRAALASVHWRLLLSRNRAERKRALLAYSLDNMDQGLLVVDNKGRIAVANRRFKEMLDLPSGHGQRMPTYAALFEKLSDAGEFARGGVTRELDRSVSFAISHGSTVPAVYERQRANGQTLEVRTKTLRDGWLVRTFTDVTARRTVETRLRVLADTDVLTGLANRRYLQDFLKKHCTAGSADCSIAILCLDLDRFKPINDAHGHAIGDALLKAVGARIQAMVRRTDVVARTGGDEFVVVLTSIASARDALAKAEAVLKAVMSTPYPLDDVTVSIGASIGVVHSNGLPRDADRLLQQADIALCKAKIDGRRRALAFEPSLEAAVNQRRSLEASMTQAVERKQFQLYYQPIYNSKTLALVGMEALLRWRGPTGAFIPPSEFIPIAEETGMIIEIGAWALVQACKDVQQIGGGAYVSVNISPVQFKDPNHLVLQIKNALEKGKLDPAMLVVEVTESSLLGDPQVVKNALKSIRDLGVRIALDDFGTGYSSLSYLNQFPIDILKIDRSFVNAIPSDGRALSIMTCITGLAKALGMTIVVEGIEHQEQLNCIRDLGCQAAQGYLLARPAPIDTYIDAREQGTEGRLNVCVT
jgi:diguanylate cyclase (GGDEF)-like protein